MREKIYINKKSDNTYELITKDVSFEPGVYTLFGLDKSLFVIKKYFYKEKPKEQNTEQEQINEKQEINEPQNKKEESSTQEWYKKALELKTKLNENNYLCINDVEDVRKISYVTRQEINSGEILGIRGFDKNYYIFKKELFEKNKTEILNQFEGESRSLDSLIDRTKLPKDQILGIMEILKEQADIIETQQGVYKRV